MPSPTGTHQAPRPRTVLQDGFPLCAIDLLAPNEVAGGVSKVDEAGLGMEIQSPGVHEVLDGNHVLIWHLGTHVHPTDDAGTPLPVHQEQLVLRLWGETGTAVATSRARAVPWGLAPAENTEPISSPSPPTFPQEGRHSLLQDFPSLPRLKPERQRHVRLLWLFPSRQMSEQPPGFPN